MIKRMCALLRGCREQKLFLKLVCFPCENWSLSTRFPAAGSYNFSRLIKYKIPSLYQKMPAIPNPIWCEFKHKTATVLLPLSFAHYFIIHTRTVVNEKIKCLFLASLFKVSRLEQNITRNFHINWYLRFSWVPNFLTLIGLWVEIICK